MTQLEFRTPEHTNHHAFLGGDSIIKAKTLLDAAFEVKTRILLAVKAYNRQNPDLPLPEPETGGDDNETNNTFNVNLPYRTVNGNKKSLAYFAEYSGWIVPTTGELAGVESLADAVYYILNEADKIFQEMVPNSFVSDPRGLITIDDNNTSRSMSYTLPFDLSIDDNGKETRFAVDGIVMYDLANRNLPTFDFS